MNKTTKILLLNLIIMMIIILFIPNKASAVLQSNGGTPAKNYANNWISLVRNMQTAGGTLGLTDTITPNTLISNNTNLDIHMEKNTEYGAMAILSASSYGNPSKIENGQTTTGNKTGIVINVPGEVVMAVTPRFEKALKVKNASNRYKNVYSDTPKIGDATIETNGWHETNVYTSMGWGNLSDYVMTRGIGLASSSKVGIFSWYFINIFTYKTEYDGWQPTRAVIVVGAGI